MCSLLVLEENQSVFERRSQGPSPGGEGLLSHSTEYLFSQKKKKNVLVGVLNLCLVILQKKKKKFVFGQVVIEIGSLDYCRLPTYVTGILVFVGLRLNYS